MSVLSEEEALRRSRAPGILAIQNLSCWGCGLKDISVLATAKHLEILNLRYNTMLGRRVCSDTVCLPRSRLL